MKNISTGKLIGFVIFILVVFGAAFFQLAVIDATVGGWLFFAVLLCALVFFRFSKYWQKLLGGGLAGFNKLWIYLLAVIALQANCVFARPDLKVSYRGTLVREMIRFAKNLPAMKGDGMLAAGAKLSSKRNNCWLDDDYAINWKKSGSNYASCGWKVQNLEGDILEIKVSSTDVPLRLRIRDIENDNDASWIDDGTHVFRIMLESKLQQHGDKFTDAEWEKSDMQFDFSNTFEIVLEPANGIFKEGKRTVVEYIKIE